MALRLPAQLCLRASSITPLTLSITRLFSSSVPVCTQRAPQPKRARRDQYAREQAKAKKKANLSRREAINAERALRLGDPIRGETTPFVQSFDDPSSFEATSDDKSANNFLVASEDVDASVTRSRWLLGPKSGALAQATTEEDIQASEAEQDKPKSERRLQKEREMNTAEEALRRISNLSLGSSKDRLRFNIQRCVNTFGRHQTDAVLDVDPITGEPRKHKMVKARIGEDTGSSEVQIGILTAKIRVHTQFLEGRGRMDKHNRRSLTLLVHKRQKLLRYLQRQDKGGARWQNLVKTLGLTDGTWRGEITVPRYLAEK